MGISEFIHFGEMSYCFILSSSADKNTFAEQLYLDSQRMFQIVHERSLISHMGPGIFELSCNYDTKSGDYVTGCLKKTPETRCTVKNSSAVPSV